MASSELRDVVVSPRKRSKHSVGSNTAAFEESLAI